MFSKKSLELLSKYFKEIDYLLPRVLKNLKRMHECAMKNGHRLVKKEVYKDETRE